MVVVKKYTSDNVELLEKAEIMVGAIMEMYEIINWKHLWQTITDVIDMEAYRNPNWYQAVHPLVMLSKPQVKKYYLKFTNND